MGRRRWKGRPARQRKPNVFQKTELKNEVFKKFYEAQGILPSEEWASFEEYLRKPLPTTWRINALSAMATELREQMRTKWQFGGEDLIVKSDDSERTISPPAPLCWYPNDFGWQVDMSRGELRKHDQLRDLHKWLVFNTEQGYISRQEAVSMIPPFLLQVEPHHKVLDMCASPGSKTAQLLEFLHAKDRAGVHSTGMVVANDNDTARAYMLVRQCKRIGSHSLLVTVHDAQRFPNLNKVKTRAEKRKAQLEAAEAAAAEVKETAADEAEGDDDEVASEVASSAPGDGPAKTRTPGMFDRILCDVPCSGDGTIRKNIEVWSKWCPRNGLVLHPLQVQIAMRGTELLNVGGLMVYSTCSMNPMEDEAVVAELLRRGAGGLELVDVSGLLHGLERRPGMHSWKVMGADMAEYATYDEAHAAGEGHLVKPSMFPPTAETAASYHLERCLRCYPHLQNSGGFFIAALRKVSEIPAYYDKLPGDDKAQEADIQHRIAVKKAKRDRNMKRKEERREKAAVADEAKTEAAAAPADADASSHAKRKADCLVAGTEGESDTVEPASKAPADSTAPSVPARTAAAAAVVDKQTAAPTKSEDTEPAAAAAAMEEDDETASQATSAVDASAAADVLGVKPKSRREQEKDAATHKAHYDTLPEDSVKRIEEFYGLKPGFPMDQLFVKSVSGRAVHFMARCIAETCLKPNVEFINTHQYSRIKAVHAGTRVLDSSKCACGFRLVYEGSHLILPYVTKRILYVDLHDFMTILRMPRMPMAKTAMSVRVLEAFEGLDNGSVAIVLRRTVPRKFATDAPAIDPAVAAAAAEMAPTEADPMTREYLDTFNGSVCRTGASDLLVLVAWKGNTLLTLQMAQPDTEEMEYQMRRAGYLAKDDLPPPPAPKSAPKPAADASKEDEASNASETAAVEG